MHMQITKTCTLVECFTPSVSGRTEVNDDASGNACSISFDIGY